MREQFVGRWKIKCSFQSVAKLQCAWTNDIIYCSSQDPTECTCWKHEQTAGANCWSKELTLVDQVASVEGNRQMMFQIRTHLWNVDLVQALLQQLRRLQIVRSEEE